MVEKPSKLDKLSRLIPLVTILFAVVGVIFPIIGFAFEQGYLSVFGLNSESFPRAITELWTYSFYVMSIGLITALNHFGAITLLVVGAILLMIITVLLIVTIFGKEKLRGFFQRIDNLIENESFKGDLIKLLKIVYKDTGWVIKLLYFTAIVLVLIALMIGVPLKYGIHLGNKQLEEYSVYQCERELWSRCVQIYDANSNIILHEGFMVTASDKYIAFYDGEKTTVISRLPSYSIVRYKSPN